MQWLRQKLHAIDTLAILNFYKTKKFSNQAEGRGILPWGIGILNMAFRYFPLLKFVQSIGFIVQTKCLSYAMAPLSRH